MFLSGPTPLWPEGLITPGSAPGGALRVASSPNTLETYLKEWHPLPLAVPSSATPRTTSCVVLRTSSSSSSTPQTILSVPISPLSSTSPSASPLRLASTMMSSGTPSAAVPKLKFGVERLLSQDSGSGDEESSITEASSHAPAPNDSPPSSAPSPLFPLTFQHHASTLLAPMRIASTSLTSRAGSPPCGFDSTNYRSDSSSGYIFNSLLSHASNPFLPFRTVFNSTASLGPSYNPGMTSCGIGSPLTLSQGLVSPITSTHVTGMGSGTLKEAGSRRKRSWTRAVFSTLQRKGLEKRFLLQKYITKPDRRQLAATLGLTDAQVKVWFQNRRMKWRHAELRKLKLSEEEHKKQAAKFRVTLVHHQTATSSSESYFCQEASSHSPVQGQAQAQKLCSFSQPLSDFHLDSESEDTETDFDRLSPIETSEIVP